MHRPNRYLERFPHHLFPLAAADRSALFTRIAELEQAIATSADLSQTASQTYATFQTQGDQPYVLTLLGGTKEELFREIQRAHKGLDKAFEQGKEWQTPGGSYFTPNPQGKKGGVACVYPGAFTSYPGVGQDLPHLFSWIYDGLLPSTSTPSQRQLFHETNDALYPKALNRPSMRQLEQLDLNLLNQPVNMLASGILIATVGTQLLKHYFKVAPQLSFGYSLGEYSMMFATEVSTKIDGAARTISDSDLFVSRLSGPKNTVREFWGMPLVESGDGSDLWGTYVLLANAEQVRTAIAAEPKAYLTHVNTPEEVVIAGDRAACERVIAQLGCNHFPMDLGGILHCDPVWLEFDRLANYTAVPVTGQPSSTLYSAADYGPTTELTSESIGQRIATALCQPCDFPRLINRAYEDGARIFIEMGPGSTCTRWLKETLNGQDHLVVGLDMRGVNDQVAIVRSLAKLLSHQVPMDIAPLYEPLKLEQKSKRSLVRVITLGEPRIYDQIVTEANRQRFADQCRSVTPVVREVAQETVKAPTAPIKEIAMVGAAGHVSSHVAPGSAPPTAHLTSPTSPTSASMTTPPPPSAAPSASGSASSPSQGGSGGGLPPRSNAASWKMLEDHYRGVAASNLALLRQRQEGLRQFAELIQRQMEFTQQSFSAPANSAPVSGWQPASPQLPKRPTVTPPDPLMPLSSFYSPEWIHQPRQKAAGVIFDEIDLLELSCGKLSNVLGAEYEAIDALPRAARIPMPPYLFVSRITKIEATRGKFEDSIVESEYDIPADAWFVWGDYLPVAVAIEASHTNIFLMGYLGIDFQVLGQRVYRALGGTVEVFSEMPRAGDTMRSRVRVHSFTQMGETLVFKFTYEMFKGDRKILQMDSGAGFFSDEELQSGQGITLSRIELKARSQIQKQPFEPFLTTSRTSFTAEETLKIFRGNLAEVLGESYAKNGLNPAMFEVPEPMLMVERITHVDPKGGAWGLGLVRAEKDLHPSDWYFNCHFKNDFCMPGTVTGEGFGQLLIFYAMYLGFSSVAENGVCTPILNLQQLGKYRGEIRPTEGTLTYQLEVTAIGLEPRPYLIVEASLIFQGKTISVIKDLGMSFCEEGDPYAMKFENKQFKLIAKEDIL